MNTVKFKTKAQILESNTVKICRRAIISGTIFLFTFNSLFISSIIYLKKNIPYEIELGHNNILIQRFHHSSYKDIKKYITANYTEDNNTIK